MTYLEMVQEAMKRAKVRSGVPTTLDGVVDAGLSFKEYVNDSWRELQEESTNWFFRQKLDQTFLVHPSIDTDWLAVDNVYGDPNMTGSGISVALPFPNNPWGFVDGQLVADGSVASDATVYLGFDAEANTKYTIYLEVGLTNQYFQLSVGGEEASSNIGTGTHTYSVTTGANPPSYVAITAVANAAGYINTMYIAKSSLYGEGDEYSMPTDLETINYRTCSIYTLPAQDETPVTKQDYEYWRTIKDTVDSAGSRPSYIIERPDGVLQFWPVPDSTYTFRYDGVWDIDNMVLDDDTPGSNITGARTLPERYDWVIVYDACRRFYEDHEDAEGLAKMQAKYQAQRARLSEKQTGKVYVKTGALTGMTALPRRLR